MITDHEFKGYTDMPEYCVEELPHSGDTCNRHIDEHQRATDDQITFQVNPVKLTEALLTKWYSGEYSSGDADDAIDLLAEMAGYTVSYDEGVATLVAMPKPAPRLEIIHSRDPDESCEHSFYLDGQRMKHDDPRLNVDVTSLDPGRGWEFQDWAGNAIGAINGASDAAKAELYEYYSYGSVHIDGWPEDGTEAANWLDHVQDTPDNRAWWQANFPDIGLNYLF